MPRISNMEQRLVLFRYESTPPLVPGSMNLNGMDKGWLRLESATCGTVKGNNERRVYLHYKKLPGHQKLSGLVSHLAREQHAGVGDRQRQVVAGGGKGALLYGQQAVVRSR